MTLIMFHVRLTSGETTRTHTLNCGYCTVTALAFPASPVSSFKRSLHEAQEIVAEWEDGVCRQLVSETSYDFDKTTTGSQPVCREYIYFFPWRYSPNLCFGLPP
jgi:hypothetical protein